MSGMWWVVLGVGIIVLWLWVLRAREMRQLHRSEDGPAGGASKTAGARPASFHPYLAEPSEAVKALARIPGQAIPAIRLYREQTGAGLKDAKDVIDALRARGAD